MISKPKNLSLSGVNVDTVISLQSFTVTRAVETLKHFSETLEKAIVKTAPVQDAESCFGQDRMEAYFRIIRFDLGISGRFDYLEDAMEQQIFKDAFHYIMTYGDCAMRDTEQEDPVRQKGRQKVWLMLDEIFD